jgi:RNA polymerase sigma-70 factor (ECF subfamily)
MAGAETSPSLLVRIRDPHDNRAWELFVDLYTPVVYRFLISKGLQDADAVDLTQETLIEVARCIQQFEYRPETGRFRNWLATVVRRRLYKFWNQKRIEVPIENDLVHQGDDAQWLDFFQAELLKVGIERVRQQVEEKTWQVFSQTWIDDVPAEEVSRKLDLPIDLVYSAKARFLKRLESEIRILGDDCGWLESI